MVMKNELPRVSSLFEGIVYEAFAGGVILLDGEGEGRCSGGFGGWVSGSGFAASVFDIWAMRDDGPPKMSSAKNDFASRNEVIRMKNLHDSDIEEMFSRSSGPGGQHVNKVSTAVTLRHVPTGLSVTVSDSRSQAANRETARRRLLQKINEAAEAKKLEHLAEASRERRRKAKRSRGTKAKLVESKRRRSETKKMRGKVA